MISNARDLVGGIAVSLTLPLEAASRCPRGCSWRWSAPLRRARSRTFARRRPARKPFPAHLPRERVVIAAPAACPCCGSAKLSKLGELRTDTLGSFRSGGRRSRHCGGTSPGGNADRSRAAGGVRVRSRGSGRLEPLAMVLCEKSAASAAAPAERALRARGDRPQPLDAGRSRRGQHGGLAPLHARSRRMSWPLRPASATTSRFRSSQRVRRTRAASGFTFATTARLVGGDRRPP